MAADTNAIAHTAHEPLQDAGYRKWRTSTNRLGLWLFLLSDSFVFGGLLVARSVLWQDTRPELNQYLGFLVTAMLLASSFFMNRAEVAISHNDLRHFKRSMLTTIALGTAFLIGVIFVEWPLAAQHFTAGENVYGAVFYTMTGMHAFHVLTGVVFLGLVLRKGLRGMYNHEYYFGVEAAAVYWHFVDVVWIFFYPALYLIGVVTG